MHCAELDAACLGGPGGRTIAATDTMIRLVTHVKGAVVNALRLVCLLAGAWLAGLVPVAYFAEVKREMNAAVGHMPNMDPGTSIFIALMFIILVLAVLVVIEVCRSWVWENRPLTPLSFFVLGLAATWPIGVEFSSSLLGRADGTGVLLACPASVAAFYVVRRWRISRYARISNGAP
jgi:hypothetical protein